MCDTIRIHEASNPPAPSLQLALMQRQTIRGWAIKALQFGPQWARGEATVSIQRWLRMQLAWKCARAKVRCRVTPARFLTLLTTVPMPTHPALP
jgi:hypothetical protein